jgi:mitochondrial import inner membrane translocase subunit TIM17
VDDFGSAFSMGCLFGSIIYALKGMWYAPMSQRLYGGLVLLKKRAPVLGGSFALWGGIFSVTECSLIHLRNKEDRINPIVSGFVTGAVLAVRAGPRVSLRNGIFGGLLLGCFQLF